MVKKKTFIGISIVFIILIAVFFIKLFPLFWGVVVDKKIDIKKSEAGNINILLMGRGGGTHEGPDLTDTIMLASINQKKNTVNLISIPRDLYVDSIHSKINSAYANGEEIRSGKGILLARSTVGSVTGVHPDYTVIIDFFGFVKLVDLLGGIDVQVQKTLDDYAYPTEGKEKELCGVTEDGIASFSAQIATGSATEADLFPCRFENLHVPAGMEHMDGALALKFVRSRHALGSEGSDFSRSKRQQLVIDAVRNKVLSIGTLTNPVKLLGMINILKDSVKTDIPEGQYDDFIKLVQKMKGAQIKNSVIDQGNTGDSRYGLLINPPRADYDGAWVLAPRAGRGNYSEIKEYVACIIKGQNCVITKTSIVIPTPTPTVSVTQKSR